VTPRTASGLLKFRPIRPGSRIALVAPASGFDRSEFDAGVVELRRLGVEPVWDDAIFERSAITAGRPGSRATSFMRAMGVMDADAVVAVRGGYGSVEILPLLDAARLRATRTAFVGYSDVTSLHGYLSGTVGLASVHGAMIEGRIAKGPAAYDAATLLASLSCEPVGELRPAGLQTLSAGEATGPFTGGTMTQLLAALATPYDFQPPAGHVLFLDEVNERPYRLHRMLMQLRLSGRLAQAAAVVFGELPGCDEPGGRVTARDVIADVLDGFPGPVLIGFPSGHTISPAISVPLGVRTAVVGDVARPRIVFEEAAAAA
jgi:muramoyltetrapeptide carboxypeptidase